MLYIVPQGADDDWYWIYATVTEDRQSTAFVVSQVVRSVEFVQLLILLILAASTSRRSMLCTSFFPDRRPNHKGLQCRHLPQHWFVISSSSPATSFFKTAINKQNKFRDPINRLFGSSLNNFLTFFLVGNK